MIRIENVETYGWEAAIRGMRNPKNSWDRSDSLFAIEGMQLGKNDEDLAQRLADAGPVHGKFLRMITITCDITAPMYWWQEYDTYKVGTVRNSCSKMHKIHSKPFTLDDFSHDQLINPEYSEADVYKDLSPQDLLEMTIYSLNESRNHFLWAKEHNDKARMKLYWWQMIQLLPASYNQRSTVQMNYAVLKNIYQYRRDHKLDEWRDFCKWIETLPYAGLITGRN